MRECWIVDPDAASIEIVGADDESVQHVAARTNANLAQMCIRDSGKRSSIARV